MGNRQLCRVVVTDRCVRRGGDAAHLQMREPRGVLPPLREKLPPPPRYTAGGLCRHTQKTEPHKDPCVPLAADLPQDSRAANASRLVWASPGRPRATTGGGATGALVLPHLPRGRCFRHFPEKRKGLDLHGDSELEKPPPLDLKSKPRTEPGGGAGADTGKGPAP